MKHFLFFALFFVSVGHAKRISVLAYNAENLFDTIDDPKTADETFLPLASKRTAAHRKKCEAENRDSKHRLWECLYFDWSPARLHSKMKNLAEQIFRAPGGRGPDILLLEEVENKPVVEELNKKFLARAGYTVYHVDSPDRRGIDQAVLSRLPFKSLQYHQLRFEGKPLRGILEVLFKVGATNLHVLALHLPSQQNTFAERKFVLQNMNEIARELPPGDLVLAGGDFNISSPEWNSEQIYKKYLEADWSAAHLEGCKKCIGTFYYGTKKEWSFFDMLFLRKVGGARAGWRFDAESVDVFRDGDRPPGFNALTLRGASDHWPIYAELVGR